jgi:hypothetical protein
MSAFLQEMRRLEWVFTEGLWAAPLLEHDNPKTVAGTTYAGFDVLGDGVTITFGVGPDRVNLIGSNNNIIDVLNITGISVIPNNSAGLIQSRELEQIGFEGAVNINVNNGIAGFLYPRGNIEFNSNNLADALIINANRKFDKLQLNSPITVASGQSVDGLALHGKGATNTIVTFVAGCSTSNLTAQDIDLIGDMDGALFARECTIDGITGVGCTTFTNTFRDCGFSGGLQIRADNTKPVNIINCYSVDNNIMILDLNGAVGDITVIGYGDRMKIINMSSAVNVHFTGSGSELEADASCTAGFLEVHGDCNFTNNSTIPTVDDDTLNTVLKTLLQVAGMDPDNSVTISGDGVNQSILTVNGKTLTITPTSMVRT